ncbi:NAD(P)-dependent dehydrogenase (short-subunit alcohol dehydrogenase family) [Paraburkholderia sp. GAS448]|jgi:NAD(P)-dependent dehydrogenase (short-subunit alcohol dehydrogenase family)|uniref:SDR family NAD(P)-dependent oxidoreductase n=1 Tax=Paraburkholderia sp. GAS448 TaxID=3035136 RepID=UPI003D1D0718
MQIDIDFGKSHVFVFGGTSGINYGIAEAFARRSAYVSVSSRKRENVDASVATLAGHRSQVRGMCADVRDFDAVGAAFDDAVSQFGPIDVLISGAAGNFLCDASSMSANGFRAVIDIDLIGSFNVMRQAHPHLRKPGWRTTLEQAIHKARTFMSISSDSVNNVLPSAGTARLARHRLVNIDNGSTLTDICLMSGAKVVRMKTLTPPHLTQCLGSDRS